MARQGEDGDEEEKKQIEGYREGFMILMWTSDFPWLAGRFNAYELLYRNRNCILSSQ